MAPPLPARDAPRRPLPLRLLVESLLTIAALVALSPLILDAWTAEFHDVAARIEHGLTLAVVAPLRWLAAQGVLDPTWDRVELLLPGALFCAAIAAALTGYAALVDPRPGERPAIWRLLAALLLSVGVGVPALVLALAVILVGAMLQPPVFLAGLGITIFGAMLGRRRRRRTIPWEHSPSGLVPAFWGTDHILRYCLLLSGLLAVLVAASLGIAETDKLLFSVIAALDRGGSLRPWLLCHGLSALGLVAVLGAPMTRRTLGTFTWEPWVAAVIGAAAMGAVLFAQGGWGDVLIGAPMGLVAGFGGTLLAGAGLPMLPRLALNPLRSVGRLVGPLAAGMMALAYGLSTGFLGCDAAMSHPGVTALSRQPGASEVLWVEDAANPGALAMFVDAGMLVRLGVESGETRVLDARALPLEALRLRLGRAHGPREGQLPTARLASLAKDDHGRVFLLAQVVGQDVSALLELDPLTLEVINVAEDDDGCPLLSWTWNPRLAIGVAACADRGEVLLYEPNLGRFLSREELGRSTTPGVLGVDPLDGSLISLSPGNSPFIQRIDMHKRRPVAWRFVGMANLRMAVDAAGTVHMPRFLGRQVVTFDMGKLEPIRVHRAGFATGPVVVSEKHERVFSASLLDGYVYAARTDGEGRPERLRVGGLVRSLALSDDGDTLLAGGFCGVVAVDLERWMAGR